MLKLQSYVRHSSGGAFEVSVDGTVVFSKLALGRHARAGEVLEIIREESGRMFDPRLVKLFCRHIHAFEGTLRESETLGSSLHAIKDAEEDAIAQIEAEQAPKPQGPKSVCQPSG